MCILGKRERGARVSCLAVGDAKTPLEQQADVPLLNAAPHSSFAVAVYVLRLGCSVLCDACVDP